MLRSGAFMNFIKTNPSRVSGCVRREDREGGAVSCPTAAPPVSDRSLVLVVVAAVLGLCKQNWLDSGAGHVTNQTVPLLQTRHV
jgi:hypothetical protein